MSRTRLFLALAVSAAAAVPAAVAVPDAWAGSIRGKIMEAGTRVALGGICVTASPEDNSFQHRVTTEADGTYVIDGLPPGAYEVFADDCNDPVEYSPVDYKNIRGLNRNRAKLVKIKKETAAKKKINFKLPRAGHIRVLLRTSDDVPISNTVVCPWWFERDRKKNGNVFQSGFCGLTDGDGEVVLHVTPGKSVIETGGVYYDGENARAFDFDGAEPVDVASQQTVTIVFKPNPTDIAAQ